MEWKVTAGADEKHAKLYFWLESLQRVSVGEYNEMEFGIMPLKTNEDGPYEKWKLRPTLYDGRQMIADVDVLYDTLTEATTDAEALVAYLQNTTNAPGIVPGSVRTLISTVRIAP